MMDQATLTMIENLHKITGKSLDEWIALVQSQHFAKHGEIMAYLKGEHGLTHGYANLVAHKAKGSDAGSADNQDDLIVSQYKGKEHLKPIYDALMSHISKFGSDVEVAPKNAYVSLRRSKQFAMLIPATKTRFEIGINLKGQPGDGRLEANTASNAMCSHKINIASVDEVDDEVIGWLRLAYEKA
jgi:predicted transport protein